MGQRSTARRAGLVILAALAALLAAAGAASAWLAEQMVRPSRPRISLSARPVLGVVLREPAEGAREGVPVARAVPPASEAGVEAGDRLLEVRGVRVASPGEVAEALAPARQGDRVRLELWREGSDSPLSLEVPVEVRTLGPGDSGLPFEDVAFANPAGLTLRGWFVPPPAGAAPAPAVAYGHGNGTDRRHWLGIAWEVHRAGVAQLMFDFAGRGESDGTLITLGAREALDLSAALDFLAARPDVDRGRLMLAGRSMGAAAAVLCAARRDDVRALVLDSPFADLGRLADRAIAARGLPPGLLRPLAFRIAGWRAGYDPASVRPVDAIRRVRAPVLLLHGDRDELVPVEHGRELAAAAGGAVTFVTLRGLGHNDPRKREHADRIAAFLAATGP